MGAYFLKKQARSPILEGFGRNIYALLSFSGQQYFHILSGEYKRGEEGAYREYQSALRKFNNHLKSLSRKLRLHSSVTSYTLRHSWATTAKYRGVPIEMISESLGHKSIKTTQIYLKGFELEERTKVNKQNYYYVRRFKIA